jgi:hypothetical protein
MQIKYAYGCKVIISVAWQTFLAWDKQSNGFAITKKVGMCMCRDNRQKNVQDVIIKVCFLLQHLGRKQWLMP